jgi:hypothetical protein
MVMAGKPGNPALLFAAVPTLTLSFFRIQLSEVGY